MTETTPDTGTDRKGCTCGEGDAVGDTTPGPCFVDASGVTVHRPPDLTDEEHRRRLWRDLADKDIQHGVDWPGVVRVLFADIDALTAGVEFHTGTDRVELTDAERAQRLLTGIRERDDDAAALRFINGWMQALTAERDLFAHNCGQWMDSYKSQTEFAREVIAERDAARAELASANARCAELEAEVEGYSYWSMVQKNAALQATLDRISALADEWEQPGEFRGEANNLARRDCAADLRSALTPEGKP